MFLIGDLIRGPISKLKIFKCMSFKLKNEVIWICKIGVLPQRSNLLIDFCFWTVLSFHGQKFLWIKVYYMSFAI